MVDTVGPSDRLSVTRWYHVKTSQNFAADSPIILVSSWLTSVRNSTGNIGSEGVE